MPIVRIDLLEGRSNNQVKYHKPTAFSLKC